MSWMLILPIIQGVLGAIGMTGGPGGNGVGGLFSAEVQRWLLMLAGLPLTVQVPLAAHALAQNTKKANLAVQTLASLPLANLNVNDKTRAEVYAFANIPEPPLTPKPEASNIPFRYRDRDRT